MRANYTPQDALTAQHLTHDVHFNDEYKVLAAATKVPVPLAKHLVNHETNLNKTLT